MPAVYQPIIDALIALAATALTGMIVRLFQKVGLALDADRTAQVEYWARQAVLYAEERAAAQIGSSIVKWSPGAKLEAAVAQLMSKAPRITREEAEAIIHAALPQVGLGAAAAAAELGKALRTPGN